MATTEKAVSFFFNTPISLTLIVGIQEKEHVEVDISKQARSNERRLQIILSHAIKVEVNNFSSFQPTRPIQAAKNVEKQNWRQLEASFSLVK